MSSLKTCKDIGMRCTDLCVDGPRELFGMMMNWGLVDVLAQQLEMNTGCLLMRARGGPLVNMLYIKYASVYNYKDQRMEKQIESIWTQVV